MNPLKHAAALVTGAALLGVPAAMAQSPKPAAPQASPSAGAETAAVAASNTFGIQLYTALVKADPASNLFISPYSMSVALTMAAEGARRETEEEMARVLHFPAAGPPGQRSVAAVHAGNAALAQRFRDAAGSADPKMREHIDAKRKQLDTLNARLKDLQKQEKWNDLGPVQEEAQAAVSELNDMLTKVDRFDLRVANALWVERTFSLVPDYVKTIDEYYGSGGVTPLDILGNPEKSRTRINTWVEEKTEHRIKDLIPAGSLTGSTRLIITNAVYFKGQWAEPFTESFTRDEDFMLADGNKVRAKLMHDYRRAAVPYAAFNASGDYFVTPHQVPRDEAQRPQTYPDDHGFQMIELPYKGGELSMVLIAPRDPKGLPALEARLSAASLDSWLSHLERRAVDTALPRFKLEFSREMTPTLQGMGMKRAFASPDKSTGAQFPGMSSSSDPSQQLFIGAVQHKAWVEVNEIGTEAAAATAVMMEATAARPVELIPFTPQFHADHPFVFLIRDTKTGLILFIGRMTKPNA